LGKRRPRPPDSAMSTGATFVVPFKREDVFKELAKYGRPLGVPLTGPDAIVLQAPEGKSYDVDDQFQVGWQRAALWKNQKDEGYVVNECIELMPGWLIKWRQVDSKKKGLAMPANQEITVKFADTPEGGTWVWFDVDFDKFVDSGTTNPKELFLKTKPKQWEEDMTSRGYKRVPLVADFDFDPRKQHASLAA